MNKIKSVLFAAGVLLALAFVFGCSSSDDGGGGSGGNGSLSSSSKANGQSGSSTLKECDAVFNPDKKFCYDGVVYDKCDGMAYNPTSHICENGVATPAKCGNVNYNPLTHRCTNGVLETKCGSSWYNASYTNLRCQNNKVEMTCNLEVWFTYDANYGCCGSSRYEINPNIRCTSNNRFEAKCGNYWKISDSELRYSNNSVQAKCGSTWYSYCSSTSACCGSTIYNPTNNLGCSNGVLKYKCGDLFFDDASNQCCMSPNWIGAKCGDICYSVSDSNLGCSGGVLKYKCGNAFFDDTSSQCCISSNTSLVGAKCGDICYNVSDSNLRCQSNEVETKCGTSWYDANNANLRCEGDVVEIKCENNWYNTTNYDCQNGTLKYYIIDVRDGKKYESTVIGNQIWMAENLNYRGTAPDTLGKCYNNTPANCNKYGRLYDWATAMALPDSCNSKTCSGQINAKHKGICPSGWHVPSDADWNVLMKYVNPSCSDNTICAGAGTKLKANSSLWAPNTGTDNYGFSAMPGGYGNTNGNFSNGGYDGWWWSASEDYSSIAYLRRMRYNDEDVSYHGSIKYSLRSVRCVQDSARSATASRRQAVFP